MEAMVKAQRINAYSSYCVYLKLNSGSRQLDLDSRDSKTVGLPEKNADAGNLLNFEMSRLSSVERLCKGFNLI